MHKRVNRIAAFAALFALLFLLAPTLSNAKPGKIDIRLLIKKPVIWVTAFWNVITPIFDGRDNGPKAIVPGDPAPTIKPLTDSLSPKLSKGD
jgi:hypothetical protein